MPFRCTERNRQPRLLNLAETVSVRVVNATPVNLFFPVKPHIRTECHATVLPSRVVTVAIMLLIVKFICKINNFFLDNFIKSMSQKINSLALRLGNGKYWKLKTKKFNSDVGPQKNLLLLKLIETYLNQYNITIVDYKLIDYNFSKFFFCYIYIQKKWKRKKNRIFFIKKKVSKRHLIAPNHKNYIFQKKVMLMKRHLSKTNAKLFLLKKTRGLLLELKKKKLILNRRKHSTKKRKKNYKYFILKLKKLNRKRKLFSLFRILKLQKKKTWFLQNVSYRAKIKSSRKNKIKNLLNILKVKLKIQAKLQKILHYPIILQLKNCLLQMPERAKRKNFFIWKRAKQHKQNKNLKELIFILSLSFFYKKVALFTNFIAKELERKKQHWKILNSVKYVMRELNRNHPGIIGFRLSIWGKINNSKRTRKYTISMGRVALGNLNYRADYSLTHSYTSYGLFGIKSWLVY